MTPAAFAVALAALAAAPPAADFDFDRDVAPILVRSCLECHSGPEPKGGLVLSGRRAALEGGDSGEVIVPGKPEESLLWDHVEGETMPPKRPLPDSDKEAIRRWIADGAPWGAADPLDLFDFTTDKRAGRDWWSLRPIVRSTPPPDPGPRARDPIDGFVVEALTAKGLAPAPEADRRALIRRLSFDLNGLPPSPEQIDAFLTDGRPDAYERLVDRLLASPQYGVRWARLWLDLARYGESNGFEHDEFRPDAWPYRDWVVNALNRDLPYDEFARLQLAGDVLRPDDPDAIEATGFLVAGAYDSVGQTQQSAAMRRVVREDELEDIVGTVSQSFLGLTVHCARCHDHKFDPIRQEEYYRLASALSGVRHGERDLTALDPEVRAARAEIDALSARLAAIEEPARVRLRGGRPASAEPPPEPFARWDFEQDAEDRAGTGLHAILQGGATLGDAGLALDGSTGFAATIPLTRDLRAKTLEAWVRLDDLTQRGGAVIGLQTPDGAMFDAIVFGEVEPGRWMAGSEGFGRSRSFGGPEETEAAGRPIHVAIAYDPDGTIRAYRDGRPYGEPYRTSPPAFFRAGGAQVVFGLRHAPVGGNRMLAGRILGARLYDRALTPAQVAASAAAGEPIPPDAILASLSADQKAEHDALRVELAARKTALAQCRRRAYAVTPSKPDPTHRLIRGNPTQPGEVVTPGGVASLSGVSADFGLEPDATDPDRRARLAAWITAPGNSLFARVIVNRIWQAHFGAGLVETPSDFGFNGGRPSHPELLDRLAADLIDSGWSLKHLHRRIVTSATYRQASRPDPAALRIDAGNRLLWRKSPARLEAEMVRDAMLAAAGVLNPRLGGPGYREFEVTQAEGTKTNRYTAVEPIGPDFDRRTLYRSWARGGRSGFLDAFDCPDPSTTAPKRASTTTPLQALALLNNALTLRLADRMADRLRREAGDDPRRQVERAYRLAFGRAPEPDEAEAARRVVAAHGAAALARAILNCSEFLYVD